MLDPLPAQPKTYLRPSLFWGIRQELPLWLSSLLATAALVLPLCIWTIVSTRGLVQSNYLPTPLAVLQTGVQMFQDGPLIRDILTSSGRVLLGFLAAALVGIPIGILMGTFQSMRNIFGLPVGAARYMPISAFIPLIIIWAGLDEPSKIIIIFFSVVFYNALMVSDAVKFIPEEMLNVAYTLGAKRWHVLIRVILPMIVPSILDTLRVNIASAWNALVISEWVGAEYGLGFRIVQAQKFIQTDQVLICIVLIGTIGLLTDYIFQLLGRILTPWAE